MGAPLPPCRVRLGSRLHSFPGRALVMGIVNVTPDSFSDGGSFLDPEAALVRGLAMAAEGADLLDVGGESTRPGAEPVSAAEELSRVLPVIRELARRVEIPISIDTHKAEVAAAACDVGARVINDIGGLRLDPAIADVAAASGATLILMHSRRRPADMQEGLGTAYGDVVDDVGAALSEALRKALDAGVDPEATVLDPGIGFGKTPAQNVALLSRLDELCGLGRPVLVGTSRKSFLGGLTGRPVDERLAGTVASVAVAVLRGASLVRVHDVREAVDAVAVAGAVMGW